MRCVAEPDLPGYAERVLPHLLRDPVRNNVAATIIMSRRDGVVPTEPDALWLRVDGAAGDLAGVALCTPPYGLLVTDMPDAAVDPLADHVATHRPTLSTVDGPVAVADRFAWRYCEHIGTAPRATRESRMYHLDQVAPPRGIPGRLRAATAADRDLLVQWSAAFSAEALPPARPNNPALTIDSKLAHGGLIWIWTLDAEPVSMSYLSVAAAGVVRVSGVYTPPELRGRGYASAGVAATSQRALDAGAVACMLYTDLANPTSNKIYQRIGYRPVADTRQWSLTQRQPAVSRA
ncbi:GNAT family N-acetyltransferase [Actinomycetes bacterium KLBMP 9797]